MPSSGAATGRWLVVLLLAVGAIAAPVTVSAKAPKAIVMSISHQMLWAYKGDQVVLRSYVSTGRAGFDTPLGSFAVVDKLPSQTMEGVIGGEYYNVLSYTQMALLPGRAHGEFPARERVPVRVGRVPAPDPHFDSKRFQCQPPLVVAHQGEVARQRAGTIPAGRSPSRASERASSRRVWSAVPLLLQPGLPRRQHLQLCQQGSGGGVIIDGGNGSCCPRLLVR